MRYDLTAAVERALAVASTWRDRAGRAGVELAAVLLGLLSESECRGARLLAAQGIDVEAVIERWRLVPLAPVQGAREGTEHGALEDESRSLDLSPALDEALRIAGGRLWEYPQPLSLATEHVLLGIVAGESEVASWLRERGFDADALEAEIHRLSGHTPGPLPIDEAPDSLTPLPLRERSGEGKRDSATHKQNSSREMQPVDPPLTPPHPEGTRGGGFPDSRVLRVIDAATNRAAEGLRVVEDYVRFILDDRHLTARLKEARHELAAAAARFPLAARHAARDSLADVGAELRVAGQESRASTAEIPAANFARVEQALRSIEEYAKLSDSIAAIRFERLRYLVYSIERAVSGAVASRETLARARLCVLLDGGSSEVEFAALVGAVLDAGAPIVQLRAKNLADDDLLARAKLLRRLTREAGALLIVNDRPDLAALADADGVHVGQEDLAVKDARAIVGAAKLVGVSTHSIEQARRAVLDGASYLGVGPTFPSGTKQFDHFPGVELARAVSQEISLPTFVIGGVTLENLDDVLATGARRVAVSGAITRASDPGSVTQKFIERLEKVGETDRSGDKETRRQGE